jgi:hypothetical protein
MKKLTLSVAVVLLLLLAAAAITSAATGVTDPVVLADLASVRQATAQYHDVDAALADGFIPTPNCIEEPGLGGMGIHYINPGRLMNPALNLLEPEILLYLETEGTLRLIGVEYMVPIGPPGGPIPNPPPPAPVLFDRPFDGPMLGHEPGMPPHYDLHVWVWQANPNGTFAPLNPNVSCS